MHDTDEGAGVASTDVNSQIFLTEHRALLPNTKVNRAAANPR
jgi:hypothetical protein